VNLVNYRVEQVTDGDHPVGDWVIHRKPPDSPQLTVE
jgi:hypothetical protein